MKLTRRESLAAGICLLAGCGGSEPQSGSAKPLSGPAAAESFGFGPAHTGSYPAGSIPEASLTRLRRHELRGQIGTSPVANDSFAAVGDEDGVCVVPFDDDGFPEHVSLPNRYSRVPTIGDGTIFVARYGGTDTKAILAAVDPDGETRWTRSFAPGEISAPVYADGDVYLSTAERHLRLDSDTGDPIWEVGDGLAIRGGSAVHQTNVGPAVADDAVVFTDGAELVAVDRADGDSRWRFDLGRTRAPPVIEGETAFGTSVREGVSAIDLESGDRRWLWEAEGCHAAPAVTDDRVAVGFGMEVASIDRTDGDELWREQLNGSVRSGVSVVGDTILTSTDAVSIDAIDVNSGERRWRAGSVGLYTPLVVNDFLLVTEDRQDGVSLTTYGVEDS